jgi:hypothetical protein
MSQTVDLIAASIMIAAVAGISTRKPKQKL